MEKKYLFLGGFLCLFFLISSVAALNYQGSLGGSNLVSYTEFTTNSGGSNVNAPINILLVKDIEYSGKLQSIVNYHSGSNSIAITDINITGASVPVNIRVTNGTTNGTGPKVTNGNIIGTGYIGYQQIYNDAVPAVWINSYIYLQILSWNPAGLSGDQLLYLEYNIHDLNDLNLVYSSSTSVVSIPLGCAALGYPRSGSGSIASGKLATPVRMVTNLKNIGAAADYFVIDGSGLGIQGTITKTAGLTQSLVYSANTGQPLASELTQTNNTFNFTLPAQNIIIGIKDSLGNKYNTSPLQFGSIPLPETPTIPPTSTPTPTYTSGIQSYSNVTIQVANLTNKRISQAYVEYYPNKNTVDNIQGYTDVNGEIHFGMVARTPAKVVVYASGYEVREDFFTPDALDYTRYVQVFTGTNAIPNTFNLTITARNANGGAPIPTVAVSYYNALYGGGGGSAYTNASGMVTFSNLASSAYLMGSLSKAGFITRQWSIQYKPMADVSLTLYMDDGSVAPPVTGQPTPIPITPLPTPVSYDTVSLSATPSAVAVGAQVTLTTSCSNVTACTGGGGAYLVTYYYKTVSDTANIFIGQYRYNSTSTKWDYRATSGNTAFTVGDYTPLVHEHTPDRAETFTYTVYLSKTGFIAIGNAYDNVLVGGGGGVGGLTLTLYAADGATTSHVSNYFMNLTSEETGITTELGLLSYDIQKLLPRGSHYELQCNKSGYIDGSYSFVVPTDMNCEAGDFCSYMKCPLYPIGSIIASNTSVTIQASDVETYFPLGNVKISVSIDGVTTEKYTGSNGESVIFNIPYNTDYSIVASKSGYCADSEWKNTGTEPFQYVGMSLKYGACSGTTATPTPTPTPSIPTVTPTLYGSFGNASIGEPAVCGSLPDNANLVDTLVQGLACNGFETKESQNMALSVLIILFCGIILGRIAKGIGVLSGVIIGSVISMAMGLLPIWIIIVVIILAGLVFAGRIFWSSGGGA